MKKIFIFAFAAFVAMSCASSGNKYLGNIPVFEYERDKAIQKSDNREPIREKYGNLIYKDEQKLRGVQMPCMSRQPEIFEVLGNVAIFNGLTYNVLLKFNKTITRSGNLIINFLTEQGMPCGSRQHILSLSSYEIRYYGGGTYLIQFFINNITTDDPYALVAQTHHASLSIDNVSYKDPDGKGHDISPEDFAIYFMESFYSAVAQNNEEDYYGTDYGCAEFDALDSQSEWNKYKVATDMWKVIYPQKWEAVKAFRKKCIENKILISCVDISDPDWTE